MEDVQHVAMFAIFFPNKYCALCEILRIRMFGLVTSFEEKEGEKCLLIHLRRTNSACYRLGYCYVLVDRVYFINPNMSNVTRNKSHVEVRVPPF